MWCSTSPVFPIHSIKPHRSTLCTYGAYQLAVSFFLLNKVTSTLLRKLHPRQASIPCGKVSLPWARSIISEVHAPGNDGILFYSAAAAAELLAGGLGQYQRGETKFRRKFFAKLSFKKAAVSTGQNEVSREVLCQAFFQESGSINGAKRSFAGSSLLSFLSRKRVTDGGAVGDDLGGALLHR